MSDNRDNEPLFEALEAERERLATRIEHDLIAQIHLLNSQLQVYEMAATPQQRQAFAVLSALMRDLLQRTIDLQTSLYPPTLSTLGLIAALETLTNQIHRVSGVQFTVDLVHLKNRLPNRLELGLYRAIEDLLNLLITHHSHHIMLTTRTAGNLLLIEIVYDSREVMMSDLADALILPPNCILEQATDRVIRLSINQATYTPLTTREHEVLTLVAQGLTNKQVALQLKIRPRTVKYHLDNIFSKLDASSRTEAVTIAIQRNLLHP